MPPPHTHTHIQTHISTPPISINQSGALPFKHSSARLNLHGPCSLGRWGLSEVIAGNWWMQKCVCIHTGVYESHSPRYPDAPNRGHVTENTRSTEALTSVTSRSRAFRQMAGICQGSLSSSAKPWSRPNGTRQLDGDAAGKQWTAKHFTVKLTSSTCPCSAFPWGECWGYLSFWHVISQFYRPAHLKPLFRNELL